jgi:isopentenyl phosphate kinase
VLKLNQAVLRAHVDLGLPAVTVSVFPSVITGQCKSSPLYPINPSGSTILAPGVLEQVEVLSRQGLLPVLHGDVVLDDSQTCAILGGDHIISW